MNTELEELHKAVVDARAAARDAYAVASDAALSAYKAASDADASDDAYAAYKAAVDAYNDAAYAAYAAADALVKAKWALDGEDAKAYGEDAIRCN